MNCWSTFGDYLFVCLFWKKNNDMRVSWSRTEIRVIYFLPQVLLCQVEYFPEWRCYIIPKITRINSSEYLCGVFFRGAGGEGGALFTAELIGCPLKAILLFSSVNKVHLTQESKFYSSALQTKTTEGRSRNWCLLHTVTPLESAKWNSLPRSVLVFIRSNQTLDRNVLFAFKFKHIVKMLLCKPPWIWIKNDKGMPSHSGSDNSACL